MSKGPLAGIRVADFTWMWAGPHCALQLAMLGAEVFRVETHSRPCLNRVVPPFADGIEGLNRGGSFNEKNQAKKSVLLDLKQEEGLQLAKELIAKSDVFIENYAVGVIGRLGLGYEVVSKLNPRIIMASLSGFGASGPYSDRTAFGNTLAAISGLSALTGYPDGSPTNPGISYADPNAGLHGAFAILAALWHREQSGVGQYIDVSLWEALVAVMPEGVMPYSMRGEQLPRKGNRDLLEAPHGIFRASGDDRWVAISVRSDDEWERFAEVVGNGLAADKRFETSELRKRHEDELEALVTAWTESRDAGQIAEALQEVGIAASPVFDMKDVAEDPHMNERGYFVELEHAEVGVRKLPGIPWKLHGTPLAIEEPAPLMGEHNEYVVMEVLGRSREEYDQLVAKQVLN